MAFEVTATRKRPQLFDNLVGQQFVVSTLKNGIEMGKIANAYLFSGPRGVGKTSLARILAKALNCEKGPTPYPCGVCSNCLAITAGNSVDVIEIDGASNTSVNDIRVIKDEILFPPTSSRYKIYIIDEVHMLSTSAFNALLKTIEEPPSYVKFIFATTEIHKVPATITSRCQQFHFQLIPLETIKDSLEQTAKEMNVTYEKQALFWIAKEATGSLRDAYTLFDQVVAFSNNNITMKLIEEKLGLAGLDKLNELFLAVVAKDKKTSLQFLFTLLEKGVSVEQIVKEMATYLRTLLLINRDISSETILGIQVSQIPPTITKAFNTEQIEAALELFLELYRNIRYSLNPSFELELAISRLTNLDQMASSFTLIRKLENIKENFIGDNVVSTTALKAKPKEQEPVKQVEQQQKEVRPFTQNDLTEIIQKLSTQRDQLGVYLSHIISFTQDDKSLKLVFGSPFALDSASKNKEKLQELILESTGYSGPIEFVRFKEQPQSKEKKENNSQLANTIASMFRGEVITEE